MEYEITVNSIWDCGQRTDKDGKPHQEDSLFPKHNTATADDRLFILCDGMGGHEAGEVASATVCEAMSKTILTAMARGASFTDTLLADALAAAYDALDSKDTGNSERKMGTTLALLMLHAAGATIAHIGDSRVYHLRPGATAEDTDILFVTEDHSLVNALIKVGELTPEQAKTFRRRNVITRAMQPHTGHRPKADIYHTTDIADGDFFYLCSDGMIEHMSDEQLCYFFSSEIPTDPQRTQALTIATQHNSDNHSAFIVHIITIVT